MLKLKKLIIIIIVLSAAITAKASVQVTAKIDSIEIFIGQQVQLTVDVTARRAAKIKFPKLEPMHYLTPGVEIVDVADADTTLIDNDMMTVSRVLTLTSFDPQLFAIPGMKVSVDGKQYAANPLALKVLMVEVDTLHMNQYFPPKDVQNNPFDWNEWKAPLALSLVVMLLCLACVYLVVRLKQNKPVITRIRIVKKVLPHQRALKAIEKLKAEKATSSADQKAYYTQLTDTLRQYIKERFGFNAMEMTSTEILERLRESGDQTMMDELSELFSTADLVKFAKYSTMLNENDLNLVNAINFIDQTKVEGMPTDERIVPQLTDDDKKTRHNRIVIKSLLAVGTAAIILLLAYVLYEVYLLMV